jgi:hypothetical protein
MNVITIMDKTPEKDNVNLQATDPEVNDIPKATQRAKDSPEPQ